MSESQFNQVTTPKSLKNQYIDIYMLNLQLHKVT